MKKLTNAQRVLLQELPDRPSDGKRCKGPRMLTARWLVDAGFAVQTGDHYFARTIAGREAIEKPVCDPVTKLHRVHAVPADGKGGNSLDIGAVRWRGEGGDGVLKRMQAYRLAFAWNMAEGIPIDALEAGCVRRFYVAVDELLRALNAKVLVRDLDVEGMGHDSHAEYGEGPTSECLRCRLDDVFAKVKIVEAAFAAHKLDETHGRLHDCAACLAKEP
jgi:hypothetical protein